jgi:UDP-N-acetylmuramoyl-L-alanyl-D-glutamate--2,6-diaminopimelate ligase
MIRTAHNTMSTRAHNARAKNLGALLSGISAGIPDSVLVSDLSLDSRNVRPGSAFVALPGMRSHGLAFVRDAIAAGANAVLWEPAAGVVAPELPRNVIHVPIPDLTRKLGEIADRFFDAPSKTLRIAAITGTNGKTTTAYMLASALENLGLSAAYAGTLGYGRIAAVQPRPHTTPDCISVHRELAELRDDGVRCVGMEVTSHALDQHRVAGVRFDTAIFTNLTHDHLDYHGTFEAYGAAKARLFDWPGLKHAIINIDDAFGRTLAMRDHAATLIMCGAQSKSHGLAATRTARYLFAVRHKSEPLGLDIEIDSSWSRAQLHTRLIGSFNVDNVLSVLSALVAFDVPLEDAITSLEKCAAPPGRMELLTAPGKALVIVDYAHTPDALDKALRAVREHCMGEVWCVFGCGGERDAGKRPVMGAIAQMHADHVIVTDDNPRGEDGEQIVAAIVKGMQHADRAVIERDRAAAIELAITEARAGDAVLIAGKGHEDYQIVGATRRRFSDREVALNALGRRT